MHGVTAPCILESIHDHIFVLQGVRRQGCRDDLAQWARHSDGPLTNPPRLDYPLVARSTRASCSTALSNAASKPAEPTHSELLMAVGKLAKEPVPSGQEAHRIPRLPRHHHGSAHPPEIDDPEPCSSSHTQHRPLQISGDDGSRSSEHQRGIGGRDGLRWQPLILLSSDRLLDCKQCTDDMTEVIIGR